MQPLMTQISTTSIRSLEPQRPSGWAGKARLDLQLPNPATHLAQNLPTAKTMAGKSFAGESILTVTS